jgi:hypothetical protein
MIYNRPFDQEMEKMGVAVAEYEEVPDKISDEASKREKIPNHLLPYHLQV